MAAYAYTDAGMIAGVVGQLGLDLRTDDAVADTLLGEAIDSATAEVDFYCGRYSQADLELNAWVRQAATWAAVKWLCVHRLNDVPKSVATEWKENYQPKLEAVQKGTAQVPRAESSRRPVTVSNTHTDLRRLNSQVRVDKQRSTGAASGLRRPTDPGAETGER